jgi:hypothetical protein
MYDVLILVSEQKSAKQLHTDDIHLLRQSYFCVGDNQTKRKLSLVKLALVLCQDLAQNKMRSSAN